MFQCYTIYFIVIKIRIDSLEALFAISIVAYEKYTVISVTIFFTKWSSVSKPLF